MSKKKDLKDELKELLSLNASNEEIEELAELGFNIKKPTRLTVIAASLYKRAANGELSAIKEIISAVTSENQRDSGGVTLVDDFPKP